eukprot:sb/3465608/
MALDTYEIKVVVTVSAVVIVICVFTLVMEILRMRPGCCWLSPPLPTVDMEKGAEVIVATTTTAAAAAAMSSASPAGGSKVITPILKPDSALLSERFAREKRVKSASAARFYAYNRYRSHSEQNLDIQKRRLSRAKTAGHIRPNRPNNGYYGHGVTFGNAETFELSVPTRRKVSFSPGSRTEDDSDEKDLEIPEDNTSTVSLESKEPPASKTPVTRQTSSISVGTDRLPDADAGTQCEAFMFVPALTYADAETQTDADEDYEDKTEVLRSVKLRTSQGTQMMERSPTPTPVCVDTACGPSTIDLITPVTPAPEPTPPPHENSPHPLLNHQAQLTEVLTIKVGPRAGNSKVGAWFCILPNGPSQGGDPHMPASDPRPGVRGRVTRC